MENLQTLSIAELPAPSANGHGPVKSFIEPTDEDIASQFPSLVQQALLTDINGNPRHWITIQEQSYRWAGTYYEAVRTTDLQKQIVRIAQNTTTVKQVGTGDKAEFVEYHPFTKPRCIDEGLRWFRQITERDVEELNPSGFINCRNGVLKITWAGNVPSFTLQPHKPEQHLFIDPPGLVYNPQASTEHVDRLLECLTTDGRKLFLEICSATLDIDAVRKLGHRVPALMAIGQGQNGKDTLREAISRIHGRSSIATIGISDWQQYESGSGRGRFSIAPLDRARLSIASENSGAFKLDNLETLKAAITGDPVYVERKGIGGNSIDPRAVFLFFLNHAPLLDGGSAAILSRWGVVQMPHSYSTQPRPGQKKADPKFKHDPEWLATEVLPALLNLLLESLATVAKDGFNLEACADDLQELRENTSHLHQFMRDANYVVGDPTDSVDLKNVWEDLQQWYKDEGWMKMDRTGDWVHVETGDGDKPVKAPRLLTKRLTQLAPSLKKERGPAPERRAVIRGLRLDGGKKDGK